MNREIGTSPPQKKKKKREIGTSVLNGQDPILSVCVYLFSHNVIMWIKNVRGSISIELANDDRMVESVLLLWALWLCMFLTFVCYPVSWWSTTDISRLL